MRRTILRARASAVPPPKISAKGAASIDMTARMPGVGAAKAGAFMLTAGGDGGSAGWDRRGISLFKYLGKREGQRLSQATGRVLRTGLYAKAPSPEAGFRPCG